MLGRGGMGQVYRARDRRLSRQVALKRILGAGALNAKSRERFDREARSVASLTHPGIVALHDYGVDDHGPYFVMELLEGADLSSWVKQRGPMPAGEVLRVAHEIGRALDYAHGRGIVHRDLKPSNLFRLPDGTIKLLDFGLARVEEEADLSQAQLSVVGLGMGTANYAAPEQREDASRADARSDIYSLGATLYFLSTGRSPRVMSEKYIPSELRALVLQLVEELPQDRPSTVGSALELFRHSEVTAMPAPATMEAMTTIKPSCPGCRAEVRIGAKYCFKCGHSLRTICANCKAYMLPEAVFCSECGLRRAESDPLPYSLTEATLGVDSLSRTSAADVPAPRADRYTLPASSCEVLEEHPDTRVVTDASALDRMKASGLPWRIRHTSTGLELLLCPPGEFVMGSPETEHGRSKDEAQHRREIRTPFYLGRTQVTQRQWQLIMKSTPLRFRGAEFPVESVSWHESNEFCRKAGLLLPSEAQWEYACRAGTQTRFGFGESESGLAVHAWFDGNSKGSAYPVSQKLANAWGFYDMHGNVWEWCADTYGEYPSAGQEQPASGGPFRVLRGGSWNVVPRYCRSAVRYYLDPGLANSLIGFRVLLVPVLVK